MLDLPYTFLIPVYGGMPESCPYPDGTDFADKKYVSAKDVVKVDKADLSKLAKQKILSYQYPKVIANEVALFVEEIGLTIYERNKESKKDVLIEVSMMLESDSVFVIERDSGELFDITDPGFDHKGINGVVLKGVMDSQKEKAYLVTTGYNRNMIRFSKNR